MSYVISKKQFLAPTEEKAQYEPFHVEREGVEIDRLDVSFGHPLYTTVADIFYVKSVSEEKTYMPVIPDGCMTLVFHGRGEAMQAYVCGVIDEIKKIELNQDEYYIFIKFLPGVGYSLVKEDANKIMNLSVPLKGNFAGSEQILSILNRETHLVERVGLISKVIRVRLHSEPNKYLIKYCTDRIFQTQGNIRVEALAGETGFTSRHIGKMFEKCVGVSPKLYSQIIRLQGSMAKIRDGKDTLLVDIAVDSGFFDHAHMNRMYKKLIHCSSGEFRKNMFDKLDYEKISNYISAS